ncbi:MAG: hypothetical protein JWO67_4001 [Streptosporangiaceae bacterium]|nr:hypothetical protein [Streptosporangiaceae bacterium]
MADEKDQTKTNGGSADVAVSTPGMWNREQALKASGKTS